MKDTKPIKFKAQLKREAGFRRAWGIDFAELKVKVSISGSFEWHPYKLLVEYIGIDDYYQYPLYYKDMVLLIFQDKQFTATIEYNATRGCYFFQTTDPSITYAIGKVPHVESLNPNILD